MSSITPLIRHNVSFSPYSVQWVPESARICAVGSTERNTGTIAVFQMQDTKLSLSSEIETDLPVRCCTFGAADGHMRLLATGDFSGQLQLWDTRRFELPVSTVKAHKTIINSVDGCGGVLWPGGRPEIATASRDGSVKVWDTRQLSKPVLTAHSKQTPQDAWAVAFGRGQDNTHRILAAGYANGDLLLFDMDTGTYVWKTTVDGGICSIDLQSTNTIVTTLTGIWIVSLKDGSILQPKSAKDTTVWCGRYCPQDPERFVTVAGDGKAELWCIDKPEQSLTSLELSKHPIISCDWHHSKKGLLASCSFDQTIRISMVQ